MKLLEVQNLKTGFVTDQGIAMAVDDVSFSIEDGKTMGLVGESGCGKSVTSLSIMRLIPNPPGKIFRGKINYQGQDLLTFSEEKMRSIRGNEISIIFQEPMTSLNPVFTIGNQIQEVIELHQPELKGSNAFKKTIEILDLVGIPEPHQRTKEFPHQLSGGMRQRVMIAIALACGPKVLIADEPTTALDVTIQAQILELIQRLQKELSMAVLLITHDLGVVAEVCDHVAVMYAGKIVETGSVEKIFTSPSHPYTRGLLDSIPSFSAKQKHERLKTIGGIVPNLLELPKGCRFQDRCEFTDASCKSQEPELKSGVACFHPISPKDNTL